MTVRQRANPILATITLFLFLGGIMLAFALNQLLIGIGMFVIALVIVLIKVTWGIAGWADDTLHQWTDKNLAPDDGVDVTFRIEEEEKNDKK